MNLLTALVLVLVFFLLCLQRWTERLGGVYCLWSCWRTHTCCYPRYLLPDDLSDVVYCSVEIESLIITGVFVFLDSRHCIALPCPAITWVSSCQAEHQYHCELPLLLPPPLGRDSSLNSFYLHLPCTPDLCSVTFMACFEQRLTSSRQESWTALHALHYVTYR